MPTATSPACLPKAPIPIPTPSTPSTTSTPLLALRPLFVPLSSAPRCLGSSMSCRASSNRPLNASLDIDFDLYDLLGLDGSSTPSQIKLAYRSLQKRCHPDIVGSQGHDMAIILNQAYSVLSDPIARLAYDKVQAKDVELRGYTGKPLYSSWLGSESEERAVFVDEVKCVGCLKCALCAEKTFAIESMFGRARVVAQWADPEQKIQEAIDACPVNCIFMVERSDLAALEFLMSKQPRGNVRVGAGNTGGTGVSNIFVDVKKFQVRFTEARDKAAAAAAQSNERAWAIQAIRSLTGWLYWQSPNSNPGPQGLSVTTRPGEPDIEKLRHAAASLKENKPRRQIASGTNSTCQDEYWVPSCHALPWLAAAIQDKSTSSRTTRNSMEASEAASSKWKRENDVPGMFLSTRPLGWRIAPTCMGFVAVTFVNAQFGGGAIGNLKEHVGGSLALEVINSGWLHVGLAGITWYFVGVAIIRLVEAIIDRAGAEKM